MSRNARRQFAATFCGYYGFGNLGDEMLAEALVLGMEALGIPRSRLAILSADPEESGRIFGIRAADRRSPVETWNLLRESETMLFGGGGLLQDVTSQRSCMWYWGIVRAAVAAGCRPWAFGQSVGPLATRFGQMLARDALRQCRTRCVRDEPSRRIVESMGLVADLAPDPVFLIASPFESHGTFLLVNVRPWRGGLSRECARMAAEHARNRSLPVIGVALAPEDERLLGEFDREGILRCAHIVRVRNLCDARSAWSVARETIGMRLHFLLLSAAFGRPALAVPYDPKVRAFAQDWGIPLWEPGETQIAPIRSPRDVASAARAVRDALAGAWLSVAGGGDDGRPAA